MCLSTQLSTKTSKIEGTEVIVGKTLSPYQAYVKSTKEILAYQVIYNSFPFNGSIKYNGVKTMKRISSETLYFDSQKIGMWQGNATCFTWKPDCSLELSRSKRCSKGCRSKELYVSNFSGQLYYQIDCPVVPCNYVVRQHVLILW